MSIIKKCKNCELYLHCENNTEIGDDEGHCRDWEIAFGIYQSLTDKELEQFIEENPEYKVPEWLK